MNAKKDWAILFFLISAELTAMVLLARKVTQQTDYLMDQKHKLVALELRGSSLVKLQTDYQSIEQDKPIIDKALPNKAELINLINQLESEASTSGTLVKINFTNQNITTESPLVKNVSFTVNFAGTYFEMVNFIKKVELMPQIIVIDRVSIQSPTGIDGKINAILTIKCFVDPKF
jgi:Tfp pilus assembly protein PilO